MSVPTPERVAAAPDRPDEPLTVVLAQATLGAPAADTMVAAAPEAIELFTEQPLHLRMAYRFQAHDPAEDQYRLRLVVHVGDHKPKPAEAVHDAATGWPDEAAGRIGRRFQISAPGLYPGRFDVTATHAVADAGSGARLDKDAWRASGTFLVLVHSRPA